MPAILATRCGFRTSPPHIVRSYISTVAALLQQLDQERIIDIVKLFIRAREDRKTIFVIGNGGSAATASHFANDVSVRADSNTARIISLTDNCAVMTAIANDFGFADVFVKQLGTLYQEGDMLVAISASGDSPNVLRAVDYVNDRGGTTIGLQGFAGGHLREKTAYCIVVAGKDEEYGPVEDVHLIITHVISMCYLMASKYSHIESERFSSLAARH